jgi:hypothetical protein
MGMVVIAVIVAGLLGVLLALLKRADAPRKAEREHLAGKQMRLVLKARTSDDSSLERPPLSCGAAHVKGTQNPSTSFR